MQWKWEWKASACLLWLHTLLVAAGSSPRCIMYLTGQHDVIPEDPRLKDPITHVILAFMRSEIFNVDQPLKEYPFFTSVAKVRESFSSHTKIMVAIGGWGNSLGFEEGSRNATNRKRWAASVKHMVDATGADGVDIDWEYPGGNRDDYRIIPNKEREWEIEAFHLLLEELRGALGDAKLLSIAVPGLERDLMAFSSDTVPTIVKHVDFINIMTYDLINRRDSVVKHHSGVADSRVSIQRYLDRGVPKDMANLGLAYYVKWVMTEKCDPNNILGCPTRLLEYPQDGSDLGRTASFSWHDPVPLELDHSFTRALIHGHYFEDGSYGYWDNFEKRWWTFDTPEVIERKMKDLVGAMGLGGVFAWGLGEDAMEFNRLTATINGLTALQTRADTKDEL